MSESQHKGHRQRMRRKFTDYGARFFDTYELLEMLLYYTVPVKDTKGMAKDLLAKFGSLDAVLRASADELTEVNGIGKRSAELILLTGEALGYVMDDSYESKCVFDNYNKLGEYIAKYFSGKTDNSVVLFSFDSMMRLLSADELYSCDFALGTVKPDAFINTAVKREAAIVVVAHNHPRGPICPSEGDRQTNSLIASALKSIGIIFAEHYLVSGNTYIGFMNKNMYDLFLQSDVLEKFYESKV